MVGAVLMTLFCTEGGRVLCFGSEGGIDAVANSLECWWGGDS